MATARVDGLRSGLVEIVRDFLVAHQMLQGLAERHHRGELRFEDLQALVGDSDRCVLFRLKERCHALFRRELPGPARSLAVRRGELFDLAVGSLFHESMKMRENVYQQQVYAPRVRRLRDAEESEAREVFGEFDKILALSPESLQETLRETTDLAAQTGRQLRRLLASHPENGLVARYLVENADLVARVFAEGHEHLLDEIYGSATRAYTIAAHSYLESTYFDEALQTLERVRGSADASTEVEGLELYAKGMRAFLLGEYRESLELLAAWLDAGDPEASGYARLASSAVSRLGKLASPPEWETIGPAAESLRQRLARMARPDDAD